MVATRFNDLLCVGNGLCLVTPRFWSGVMVEVIPVATLVFALQF